MPDKTIEVDYRKPLFFDSTNAPFHPLWYSIFLKYVEGLSSTHWIWANQEFGYCIYMINLPIVDFYRFAYSYKSRARKPNDALLIPLNRIVLNVGDSSKFFAKIDDEYQWNNFYTYQLISPATTQRQLQSYMQEDLQRFFGLTVRWEKVKRRCLVLSIDNPEKIKYVSGIHRYTINETVFRINNAPAKWLIETLEGLYEDSPYPIISDIDPEFSIGDVNFFANVKNHFSLDSSLKKYGIRFMIKEKEIDMLTINKN